MTHQNSYIVKDLPRREHQLPILAPLITKAMPIVHEGLANMLVAFPSHTRDVQPYSDCRPTNGYVKAPYLTLLNASRWNLMSGRILGDIYI
jgi:hypothetical protein